MRRLVLIALVAMIGLLPVSGFAQSSQSPASTPAPAASSLSSNLEDTARVLAIGLGAVSGMVLLSVVSTNMISNAALANLGQGAVVFAGTVIGGLVGNWLYAR